VGKSSLINAVIGHVVAPVAKRPGKTQRPKRYEVQAGSALLDLPGYGFADAPASARDAWRHQVENDFFHAEDLAGVALIVDGRVGATPLDRAMLDVILAEEKPFIVVAHKADALSSNQRVAAGKKIRESLGLPAGAPLLFASSRTGEGVREVRRALGELWKAA